MRTTLTIADGVLAAAREQGRVDHRTVGEVVSDWARAGLTARPQSAACADDDWLRSHGLRLLTPGGATATNADVNRLRDELFI